MNTLNKAKLKLYFSEIDFISKESRLKWGSVERGGAKKISSDGAISSHIRQTPQSWDKIILFFLT